MTTSLDSFNCRSTLKVGDAEYTYFSLTEAEKNGLDGISALPFSMKVLLENLLRNEDGRSVTKDDIQNVAHWLNDKGTAGKEIAYRPARVLMQDFTGVPAVVDLAAMVQHDAPEVFEAIETANPYAETVRRRFFLLGRKFERRVGNSIEDTATQRKRTLMEPHPEAAPSA